MNAETLDRLLLDRALGALTPDAAALLDAFLREHPEQLAAARRLDATTDLARKALAAPLTLDAKLPAFPRERIEAAQRRSHAAGWARGGLAMAAALLLGFSAAWILLPRPPQSPPQIVDSTPRPRASTAPPPGMWSVERLRDRVQQGRTNVVPARLTWTRPGRRPVFGG